MTEEDNIPRIIPVTQRTLFESGPGIYYVKLKKGFTLALAEIYRFGEAPAIDVDNLLDVINLTEADERTLKSLEDYWSKRPQIATELTASFNTTDWAYDDRFMLQVIRRKHVVIPYKSVEKLEWLPHCSLEPPPFDVPHSIPDRYKK